MSELSEKQLLILDFLMYYDGEDFPINTTVAQIAERMYSNRHNLSMFSGGLKTSEIEGVYNMIKNDNTLKQLKVAGFVDKNSVRGACFKGDGMDDATVVFRGTGGSYDAWNDNIIGAAMTDTRCQETVGEFMDELGKQGFHNLTTSGHSKGANLAQYATITRGNLVDRCCSFDGQGFSSDFLEKYSKQISENADKIVSINGDDDFVNIFLNDSYIKSGNKIYIDVDSGAKAHSPYELLTKGQYDDNGHFINTVEQSDKMKALERFTDDLIHDFDKLPFGILERDLVGILGMLVGLIMAIESDKLTLKAILEAIMEYLLLHSMPLAEIIAILDIIGYELTKHFPDLLKASGEDKEATPVPRDIPLDTDSRAVDSARDVKKAIAGGTPATFGVDIKRLSTNADKLLASAVELDNVYDIIESITDDLDISGSSNALLKSNLKKINKSVKSCQRKVKRLGDAGIDCCDLYRNTERQLSRG